MIQVVDALQMMRLQKLQLDVNVQCPVLKFGFD